MDQVGGGEQKREQRDNTKPGGVFDQKIKRDGEKKNDENIGPMMNVKENFPEPSVKDTQDKVVKRKALTEGEQYQEDQTAAINKAMSGGDMYDDIDVDGDDLKLAEKLIFDGFAEREVFMTNFPDRKFTICSTSAEELSIMDEVLFDMVKDHEVSGQIDLPQNHLTSMRSALFLALGYRGASEKELCREPGQHLNTIKKAVIKLTGHDLAGELDEAKKLRASLKHALRARALQIKRLPTSMIDWLSGEKQRFDRKMYKVMSTKDIIPKS